MNRGWLDVFTICAIAVVSFMASASFDLLEKFVDFSEQHESWEMDEILFTSFILSVVLAFYSYRRWQEAVKNKVLLKKQNEEDFLTRLYSRRKITQLLENEVQRSKRYNRIFSIMVIDIDYFKFVNDTHGHLVGDSVLVEFSGLLSSSVRKSDMVGRWGGEEFIIICPETNSADAITVAEKLRHKIRSHEFDVVGKKTASFGITTYRQDDTMDGLVRDADKALYRAKNEGRDMIKVADHIEVGKPADQMAVRSGQ